MGQSYRQFNVEDRIEIARLRGSGSSIRQIAAALDRAPSSVARELKRNSGAAASYKPIYAHEQTRARRWSGSKLDRDGALREQVLGRLAAGWSPEQVAGRARRDGSMPISCETIYRFIYAQIARHKDYSWRHYLPRGKSRRGRRARRHHPIEHIKHRVSISLRPAHVKTRRQAGHWEADLLHPRKSGAVVLVAQERSSRFTLLARQAGKHAQPVIDQLKAWLAPLPGPLRRTLTQDNGPEFFLHHQLNQLGIDTYFCHPHSPWQKGGIENMNGRIRRYIPAGTHPDSFSSSDLNAIANRLNSTPRKCLGYRTPLEVLSKQMLHFERESTFPPSRE